MNSCLHPVSGWRFILFSYPGWSGFKFLESSWRHHYVTLLPLAGGTSGISFRAMEARPGFYYDFQSCPTSISPSCIIIFISWVTIFKLIHSFLTLIFPPRIPPSPHHLYPACPSSLSNQWLLLIIMVNRFLQNCIFIFKKINLLRTWWINY